MVPLENISRTFGIIKQELQHYLIDVSGSKTRLISMFIKKDE